MNEKIKSWITNNWIVLAIVACIICAGVWFYSFHVYYNSGGADAVRRNIDEVRNEQQRTTDLIDRVDGGLSDSQGTADEISKSNSIAADAAGRIESQSSESEAILSDSAEQVRRGQSILRAVRERAESDTK